LQLSITDDKLFIRREFYGERIVGKATDNIIGLGKVEQEISSCFVGTVEVADDQNQSIVTANPCHGIENFVEALRARRRGKITAQQPVLAND
jgi:hypothetical protein